MPKKFLPSLDARLEGQIALACSARTQPCIHYYNLQRTQLGDEFRDEAWQTIQRVKELPLAWHPLGGNIRRCQMRRFPYGIIYSPTESEITLIAVACLHQEPDYWRGRVSGV